MSCNFESLLRSKSAWIRFYRSLYALFDVDVSLWVLTWPLYSILRSIWLEYLALDRQLNDLDQALDVLDKQSDHLHEEAEQLLKDARETRVHNLTPVVETSAEYEAGEEGEPEERGKADNGEDNS